MKEPEEAEAEERYANSARKTASKGGRSANRRKQAVTTQIESGGQQDAEPDNGNGGNFVGHTLLPPSPESPTLPTANPSSTNIDSNDEAAAAAAAGGGPPLPAVN